MLSLKEKVKAVTPQEVIRGFTLGLKILVMISLVVCIILSWLNLEKEQDIVELLINAKDLASELRQSSDDLTRFIRTFTVTGNVSYWFYFMRTIDIRNGAEPLPSPPWRNFWDVYISTGTSPRPLLPAHSFEQRVRQAGFTEEELHLLKEAQDESDALIDLEDIAFHAMQGRYRPTNTTGMSAREAEEFSVSAEPNQSWAMELVHGVEYHHWKGRIMGPIDEFAGKSQARIHQSLTESHQLSFTLIGLLSVMLVLLVVLVLIFLFKVTKDREQTVLHDALLPARVKKQVTIAEFWEHRTTTPAAGERAKSILKKQKMEHVGSAGAVSSSPSEFWSDSEEKGSSGSSAGDEADDLSDEACPRVPAPGFQEGEVGGGGPLAPTAGMRRKKKRYRGKHKNMMMGNTAATPQAVAPAVGSLTPPMPIRVLYSESFPMAWVSHTDVVGFSRLCCVADAHSLIATLNGLFSLLDTNAKYLKVERVHAVGDTFVATKLCPPNKYAPASGSQQSESGGEKMGSSLSGSSPLGPPAGGKGHSRKRSFRSAVALEGALILKFLLVSMKQVAQGITLPPDLHRALQEFPNGINENSGFEVQLRAGLDVGPVISGVVGYEYPSYDLFGETVIASKRLLQTNVVPGTVHMYDSTLKHLDHFQPFLQTREDSSNTADTNSSGTLFPVVAVGAATGTPTRYVENFRTSTQSLISMTSDSSTDLAGSHSTSVTSVSSRRENKHRLPPG